MRRSLLATLSFVVPALGVVLLLTAAPPSHSADDSPQPVAMKVPAPELQDIAEWVNSKPQTWKDLRGQVVVLHFWTFG
jgi:hypothetical protein